MTKLRTRLLADAFVIVGSVAATFQAGIGNVVAGSVFSVLQSVGAAGVGSLTSLVVGGTAAGTAGGAAVAATGISYASAASGGMVYVDMMVPYLCAVAGDWIYQKFFY